MKLRKDSQSSSSSHSFLQLIPIPYFHPNVRFSDVENQGRLLADQQVDAIHAADLAEGRHEIIELKKIPGLEAIKFPIVRIGDDIYVVYEIRKKEIGRGTFGTVNLAQNIIDGNWVVVKRLIENDEKYVDNEENALKKMGQLKGRNDLTHIEHEYQLVMELAKGINLEKLENRTMPSVRWIDLGLSAIKSIRNVFANDILHRDIKGANLHYDVETGEITPIDWGLSIEKRGKEPVKDILLGTFTHMAPELKQQASEHREYAEEDKVYLLGIIIAAKLGLVKKVIDEELGHARLEIVSENDVHFKQNKCLPDIAKRKEFLQEVRYMMSDRNVNPTLSDAKNRMLKFITPQQWQKANAYRRAEEKRREVFFNEKTEVYALGITLAELYGLTALVENEETNQCELCVVSEDDMEFKYNKKIPNIETRAFLLKKLRRMTADNPKKRYTLKQSQLALEEVREHFLDLTAKISKIAYLNVKDYGSANASIRRKIHSFLLTVDKVCLVDTDKWEKHELSYAALKHKLECKGISVLSTVLKTTPDQFVMHISEFSKCKEGHFDIFQNFYVTTNKGIIETKDMMKSEIIPIVVGAHLPILTKKLNVTTAYFAVVIEHLMRQRQRLIDKLQTENRSIAIRAEKRIDYIDKRISILQDKRKQSLLYEGFPFTYQDLFHELTILQNQLSKQGHIKQFIKFISRGFFGKTTAQKDMEKTVKELRYEMSFTKKATKRV